MDLKYPLIELLRIALALAARGMGPKVYHTNIYAEMKQVVTIASASLTALDPQGKLWTGKAFHIKNTGIGFYILPWELENWELEDGQLEGKDILIMKKVDQVFKTRKVQESIEEPMLYRLINTLLAKHDKVYLDFMLEKYAAPWPAEQGLHAGYVRTLKLDMVTGYSADDPDAKQHQLMRIIYRDPLSSDSRPVYDIMTIYSHIAERDMDLVADGDHKWRLQRRES